VSDLGEDLARAYEARVAAANVELTPAAIRAVVQQLGGGEGRAQVAMGNKQLAGQLGVSVRTVQRWQKEGGEARSVARSTPGLKITVQGIATAQQRAANARAFRERVQEQGLDVGACRVMVLVYNEDRARPRNVGPQHIDRANEGLIDALDALEDGDTAAAAEAFGHAWLGTYGIDVDAEVTDVVGTFNLILQR
jgi:DNA-binding transcriptional regulator YiaG